MAWSEMGIVTVSSSFLDLGYAVQAVENRTDRVGQSQVSGVRSSEGSEGSGREVAGPREGWYDRCRCLGGGTGEAEEPTRERMKT